MILLMEILLIQEEFLEINIPTRLNHFHSFEKIKATDLLFLFFFLESRH